MKTSTYSSFELGVARQGCLLVMLSVLLMMLPDMAHAQFGYDSAMGYSICVAASMFFGNAGKGLCTIGICILGVGALLGKISWGVAIVVGTGLAILFGAPSLVFALARIDPTFNCLL